MFYDNAEYFQTFLCGMSQLMYLLFLQEVKKQKIEMSTRPTPFLKFQLQQSFNALKTIITKISIEKETDLYKNSFK